MRRRGELFDARVGERDAFQGYPVLQPIKPSMPLALAINVFASGGLIFLPDYAFTRQ